MKWLIIYVDDVFNILYMDIIWILYGYYMDIIWILSDYVWSHMDLLLIYGNLNGVQWA